LLGFEPEYDMEASIQNIKVWLDAGGLDQEPLAAIEPAYRAGVGRTD